MFQFVWPSSINRAENDELNRVCEYAEELVAQVDDLTRQLIVLQQHVVSLTQVASLPEIAKWEEKALQLCPLIASPLNSVACND